MHYQVSAGELRVGGTKRPYAIQQVNAGYFLIKLRQETRLGSEALILFLGQQCVLLNYLIIPQLKGIVVPAGKHQMVPWSFIDPFSYRIAEVEPIIRTGSGLS